MLYPANSLCNHSPGSRLFALRGISTDFILCNTLPKLETMTTIDPWPEFYKGVCIDCGCQVVNQFKHHEPDMVWHNFRSRTYKDEVVCTSCANDRVVEQYKSKHNL